MNVWKFHNPVDVRAGIGALERLPELVGAREALLIAFPEAEPLGLVGRVRQMLGERLVAVETAIQPNPDVRWLAPLYERLWRDHAGARCVIALGGGSSIDCAKAMVTATPSGRFDELLAHLIDPKAAPLPVDGPHRALIAIPTTAGTGSEVTPWATLWDAERSRKHSLHLPWTWPEAALVDPSLMVSLPASATLASGLDALSHALEALWNVHRNPVSSSLAASAARAIVATLPALLREPRRLDLRESLAIAALQAGMAFSNTKTALAHSLSYDITLTQGVAHGIACSFSLPRVMRLAFGRDAALDAALLGIFDAVDPEGAIAALERFLAALGVSTNPADYGIAPADWDERVAQALRGPRGRNFIRAHA
ncbi:iron-containing alcohol dehydrogenase PsrA [Mitsuaria sp. GD03876]|uniref:iron-containing alcohol dehydrogenase PsrA n=1 Tax=Mitsuaria sp. GD03876 TaxID=2975399 RepID=UPI00244C45DC|nr:iron-containing alcohol dehydrogenase PsrA [Mitsuaria sp. GD03876]MDH0868165.1 iron-containing alcohol dehydrogenase [Mitsuaria sp. GD03876]